MRAARRAKFGVVFLPIFLILQLRGEDNCPLTVGAFPHVLMYRAVSESENGWRPDYKMDVDIRVQNDTISRIETATVALDNYLGAQWDISISLEPGQSMTFHPQSVFDLGENPKGLPIVPKLLKVKYGNGMIKDIYQGCDFSKTPIPPPMTVPPSSPSPVSSSNWALESVASPPRRIDNVPIDVTQGFGKAKLIFSVLINSYGDVRDVKIKQGDWGDKADAQVMDSIRKFVWFPAVKDDAPVPSVINLEVENTQFRSESQDYLQLISTNEKSCEDGEMSACIKVGDLFSHAPNMVRGTAPDYQQAIKYYNIACDGGAMSACNTLGFLFLEGRGVKRDVKEARRYFKKACDGGLQDACVTRKSLPLF